MDQKPTGLYPSAKKLEPAIISLVRQPRITLSQNLFATAGITLEYMEYNYPEYPQLYPPFEGQVSILDLLFMTGSEAKKYILGTHNE